MSSKSRPKLTKELDAGVFKKCKWDEKELVAFLTSQGLSTEGSKAEINKRVEEYLRNVSDETHKSPKEKEKTPTKRKAGDVEEHSPKKMAIRRSLDDKVAIITGASSGIGQATAIHFSSLGASLVLNGRNEAGLDETISKCEDKEKIIKVIGDITNSDILKKIVDEAIKKFGKINILVNNAGFSRFDGGIRTLDLTFYDTMLNGNLRSIIELTQLCVPHIIETKGTIVNNSSVFGSRPFPVALSYSICKAGLDQFTKSISLELAPLGVRVNSVNPGIIKTNIFENGGSSKEQVSELLEYCKVIYPLGRHGCPDEVAKTIAFLASDESSFITGELIHVDGGFHNAGPK